MSANGSSICTWIFQLLVAAFGAFFGAWAVFRFENVRQKREERKRRYVALVQATLILFDEFNTLLNIQRTYLDPVRDNEQRFALLVPLTTGLAKARVDYTSLDCLVDEERVDLWQRVSLVEQGYETVVMGMDVLNEHIQRDRIDGALVRGPVNMKTGHAEVLLDPGKAAILISIVDGFYDSVDRGVADQKDVIVEMIAFIKTLYPEKKEMKFTIEDVQEVVGLKN